jgi:diguanylate cyclase (GGDEF)-like protein
VCRLVALVVAAAAALLVVSVGHLPVVPASRVLSVGLLVAVANAAMFRVRYRSVRLGVTATSAAVIVGIALLPAPWVVLSTALGVAVGKAVQRVAPMKAAFNIGKDTLAAGAAAFAVGALPLPVPAAGAGGIAGLVVVAALVYLVTDTGLATTVLALANDLPPRRELTRNWDLRVGALAGNVLAATAAIGIWHLDPMLLAVLPPMLLASQFTYANRMRARAERAAWRHLAQATDDFTSVDLDAVLRTAVVRAAELFGADEVDVEIRPPGGAARLVRGSNGGASYDGPPPGPPAGTGQAIVTPLESRADGDDLGELRLRFRGAVALSDREQYTLRTFAAALCTAVRNAASTPDPAAGAPARAATADAVTGLPDRAALLASPTPTTGTTALVLLDLDQFKEVNDTLGHASGDRVLAEVATRLTAATPDGDLVCRLGGDEFAVLLAGVADETAAQERAARLLVLLDHPIAVDGVRVAVEASGGLAVAAGPADIEELLRRADIAMYQAKRTGRRMVTYDGARDPADVARLTLGGDLARAVAGREFRVEFQPIVDLGTGEIVSAEALARWEHPERGLLTPDRFLDAVERSGLLPGFAAVVLDQSLRAVRQWQAAGFDLPVAVNVSPRSLLDVRFPDMVADALARHDVPGDRLVVELTESLALSQLDLVDRVLGRLRELDLRLALDDFGTGYSSLATLARIPVHELKIDRAFVRAMDTSAEATAVVRSTIDLAHSLDLLVVAEGVESARQRTRLWELGCPAAQGHLFSRPVPPESLLAALRGGTGGRPGTFAEPLPGPGTVIRLSAHRRPRRTGPA